MKKFIFMLTVVCMFVYFGCQTETTRGKGKSDASGDDTDVFRISLVTKPTNLTYYQGDSLNLNGLELKVTFNDEEKTQKYVYYSKEPDQFKFEDISNVESGTKYTVECSYRNFPFHFEITIIDSRSKKNYWEENNIPADYQLNHDFWDNANVYFVLTDRFYNGNTDNDRSYGRENGELNKDPGMYFGGDLAGLTAKLDYIKDLGMNVLWITAPYEQIHGWVCGDSYRHYPYHGYYAIDYTNMDANMGTINELRTFVKEAHRREIRVVFDVVMNHPGYGSLEDLKNLVPGVLLRTDIENANLGNYHGQFIDYDSTQWTKWWGVNWIRAGLGGGYKTGSGDIDGSVNDLPDFKTGVEQGVGLPVFYTKKYSDELHYPKEGYSLYSPVGNQNYRVRDYLISWLSEWVRLFGIDGFRCDTAKHVEKEAWYQLKVACIKALREWKAANPNEVFDASSDFWMTGEVYDHGVTKDTYFSKGGFNSLINFKFVNAANSALTNVSTIDSTYSSYDGSINADESFNVLTYLSSHDTKLFYSDFAKNDKNKQKTAGSLLAFCPGAIQVFYGDECGRKTAMQSYTKHEEMYTRSQMPWDESGYNNLAYQFDNDIYGHWKKVLNFRANHKAVGGGTHTKIADTPYTFSRVRDDDKVIVVLGASGETEITVDSDLFAEGTVLHDYYSDTTADVSGGKVTFTADANGVILIESAH